MALWLRGAKQQLRDARDSVAKTVAVLEEGAGDYIYDLALAQATLDTAITHLARARSKMMEE